MPTTVLFSGCDAVSLLLHGEEVLSSDLAAEGARLALRALLFGSIEWAQIELIVAFAVEFLAADEVCVAFFQAAFRLVSPMPVSKAKRRSDEIARERAGRSGDTRYK